MQKRQSTKRELSKDVTSTQILTLKVDLEKEQKKGKELKQALEEKSKRILKIENERNVLENEKALVDTERTVSYNELSHTFQVMTNNKMFFCRSML